jgi:hypothetical protein
MVIVVSTHDFHYFFVSGGGQISTGTRLRLKVSVSRYEDRVPLSLETFKHLNNDT